MQSYQHEFIRFAIDNGILKFGEFTLKSGRVSPYFFNAGLFNTGAMLAQLGEYYAAALTDAGLEYDVIFGPAYKGIPLASALAIALNGTHGIDKPWCFNRKEIKDHGEGGQLVGAPMQGRVLIIDDVITAGTAIRESMQIIDANQAKAAGVLIALDRQERGTGNRSAIQQVSEDYGIPVISIVALDNLVSYLRDSQADSATLQAIEAYRSEYGV